VGLQVDTTTGVFIVGTEVAGSARETVSSSDGTSVSSCQLELGADFADLLDSQHSDEFDYHLNLQHTTTDHHDQTTHTADHSPHTRRSTRTRSQSKSDTAAAGPPHKSFRAEPADH